MRSSTVLAVLAVLAVLPVVSSRAWSQGQEPVRVESGPVATDGAPAPSNVRGSRFPFVHDDHRVTFRVKAPTANSVAVRGRGALWGGKTFAMSKGDDGTWTVTTEAAALPGFYYYELVVDGFGTNDPGSGTYFGWGREHSGIDIPDRAADFAEVKAVRHGEVRIHTYFARTTGTYRRAFVYAPPGYDGSARRRYPVLYLQHGSGESERAWTAQGRAQYILDNLLAEKKAVAMLVVMEQGYAVKPGSVVGQGVRGNEAFEELVVTDLIPAIDSAYRTVANRDGRAIAGLSMGGGQAVRIGLSHRELFSAVGAMSGGASLLVDGDRASALVTAAGKPAREVGLLWVGCGQQDGAFDKATAAHLVLAKAGVRHAWFEIAGGHEWGVWRASLRDLASRLFQPGGGARTSSARPTVPPPS